MRHKSAAIAIVLLFVASLAHAGELVGKCIKVIDGDTIDVAETGFAPNGRPQVVVVRVRLAHIDAPERGQDYGSKATEYLKGEVLQGAVRVNYTERDRYNRIIGEVTALRPTKNKSVLKADKSTINDHMLAFGWAWQYRAYDKDEWRAELEKVARKNREGLWQGKNPVPPWEYRKAKAKKKGMI